MTTLDSTQTDFAIALTGQQAWSPKGWYQRPEKYYRGVDETPAQFDYDLDMGARPEGVIGFANKWDPEQQKQVNAPLPVCPALGPGNYTFTVRVGYGLKKVTPRRRVEGSADFKIAIKRPPTSAPATQKAAGLQSTRTLVVVAGGALGGNVAAATELAGAAPRRDLEDSFKARCGPAGSHANWIPGDGDGSVESLV